MLELIVYGFVLAISFAAPPGAVAAETLRRGMGRGFRGALEVQLGSIVGDAFYGLVGLLGVAVILQRPLTQVLLGVVGVGLLFYLAWTGIRGALDANFSMEMPTTTRASTGFMAGVAISMTNPWAIVFWLGIGSFIMAAGLQNPTPRDFAIFYASYIAGVSVYAFVFSAIIAWGRRYLSTRVMRGITVLCALSLAGFGLMLAWQLIPLVQGLLSAA